MRIQTGMIPPPTLNNRFITKLVRFIYAVIAYKLVYRDSRDLTKNNSSVQVISEFLSFV